MSREYFICGNSLLLVLLRSVPGVERNDWCIRQNFDEFSSNGRIVQTSADYEILFSAVLGFILFGNKRRKNRKNNVDENLDCVGFRYCTVFSELLDIGVADCQNRCCSMVYFYNFDRIYLSVDGRTLD